MSLSFRNRPPLRAAPGLVVAAAVLTAPAAYAAEIYVQPIASLTSELDTNLDLEPGTRQDVEGYIADAAALVSISTPDSSTTIKPQVIYGRYPQDTGDDHLEGFLNFNTNYKTQRSSLSLIGQIEHQDEFNAEFASAQYNEVNPGVTIVDTGKTVVGATRDSLLLSPKYIYNFTPVIGAGVTGLTQILRYSPQDDRAHVDFNYYQGGAFVKWSFSQKSDLSASGYGLKYDATRFESTATGTGESLDLTTSWTPLLSTDVSVLYQRTSFDDVLPTVLNTDVNAWGASAAAVYHTQLSQFRFNLSRAISPTGGGALYNIDKVQFQYNTNFSSRLSFLGALVGLRTRALTQNLVGDDRKYAQTVVDLKWMITRTWFVQGGYQYAFQKYQYFTQSADNNRIYIRFGYQGLPQQR